MPYSIGYAEPSYTGTDLAAAAIRNQAGQFTTPTPSAITAAAAGKPAITPEDFSIVNQPAPAAEQFAQQMPDAIASRADQRDQLRSRLVCLRLGEADGAGGVTDPGHQRGDDSRGVGADSAQGVGGV